MQGNIGIIQIFEVLISAVLALLSCFFFIIVMVFKTAEAFFKLVFAKRKPREMELPEMRPEITS